MTKQELAKRLQETDSFWKNKPANYTEQEWWNEILRAAHNQIERSKFHDKYGSREEGRNLN